MGSYVLFFICVLLIALVLFYLTRNIIIAGGVGAAGIIGLTAGFLLKKDAFAGAFAKAFNSLSLMNRFDDILNQTMNLSVIIFYLTVCALFVFLSVQSIQKRRWS